MLHRRFHAVALTALLGGLLGFVARADETLRCGNSLVTVGMVSAQVVAKCGQPKDKSSTDVARRARRANGSSAAVGAVHVERWTYDRGYGKFPALLTFEQGKLKSIELLTAR